MKELSRRGLLRGLGVLLAAPAIVRASSLMPVKEIPIGGFEIYNGTRVDFQFTSQELQITIEEFSERYLVPATSLLAENIRLNHFRSWAFH